MVGLACNDASSSTASTSTASLNGETNNGNQRSFDSVTVNGDIEDGVADEERMASANVAAGGGSQYFLITPKLLPNLHYARGMRVLCIASGEHVPEKADKLDFGRCVEMARGLMRSAAGTTGAVR